MTTGKRKPVFERLKQGLSEGIAHARGELTLRTVEIPEEPPFIDATTLIQLRSQARMSQSVFAKVLNVSTKTLQSWEQGVRKPSYASRRLIQVFSFHPDVICETAGLRKITLHGVATKTDSTGRKMIVVGHSGAKKSGAKPDRITPP